MSYIKAYEKAKRSIESDDRRLLLPVSSSKGMRDFVKDILRTNAVDYCEAIYWVLFNSEVKLGGYLQYNGGYDCPLCDESSKSWYRACMEAYDKYICSDGRIRCIKDEESDKRFHDLDQRYSDDFWAGINESFEASGMFYDEGRGCWVNPETGEEACY